MNRAVLAVLGVVLALIFCTSATVFLGAAVGIPAGLVGAGLAVAGIAQESRRG